MHLILLVRFAAVKAIILNGPGAGDHYREPIFNQAFFTGFAWAGDHRDEQNLRIIV